MSTFVDDIRALLNMGTASQSGTSAHLRSSSRLMRVSWTVVPSFSYAVNTVDMSAVNVVGLMVDIDGQRMAFLLLHPPSAFLPLELGPKFVGARW
jgi:hypothetical protein